MSKCLWGFCCLTWLVGKLKPESCCQNPVASAQMALHGSASQCPRCPSAGIPLSPDSGPASCWRYHLSIPCIHWGTSWQGELVGEEPIPLGAANDWHLSTQSLQTESSSSNRAAGLWSVHRPPYRNVRVKRDNPQEMWSVVPAQTNISPGSLS